MWYKRIALTFFVAIFVAGLCMPCGISLGDEAQREPRFVIKVRRSTEVKGLLEWEVIPFATVDHPLSSAAASAFGLVSEGNTSGQKATLLDVRNSVKTVIGKFTLTWKRDSEPAVSEVQFNGNSEWAVELLCEDAGIEISAGQKRQRSLLFGAGKMEATLSIAP